MPFFFLPALQSPLDEGLRLPCSLLLALQVTGSVKCAKLRVLTLLGAAHMSRFCVRFSSQHVASVLFILQAFNANLGGHVETYSPQHMQDSWCLNTGHSAGGPFSNVPLAEVHKDTTANV